jgi:hypothetical protein
LSSAAPTTPFTTGLSDNPKPFSSSFVVSSDKAGENGVVDLCSSVVAGSNAFSPALSVAAAQEEVKLVMLMVKSEDYVVTFFIYFYFKLVCVVDTPKKLKTTSEIAISML